MSHVLPDKAIFAIHVQPKASKNEIVGPHGDAIKIRLTAPPVDGAANEALIAFLAKELRIARSAIRIVSGETSRRKLVEITGEREQVERVLKGAAKPS